MRKRILSGIIACSLLLQSLPIVSAEMAPSMIGTTDQIETVKVISFTFTKDKDLIPTGAGSATIITKDGFLLTNYHVAGDPTAEEEQINDIFEVCFTFKSDLQTPKCTHTASYVAGNKDDDIALLKINEKDIYGNNTTSYSYLTYKNAVKPVLGDTVTTIGYPDIGGTSITYTSGQVSGYLTTEGVELIKSDAKISNGNSGGTAVDKSGIFVGIPSAGRYGGNSGETLGYFLPVANYIAWIDERLVAPEIRYDSLAEKELLEVLKKFDTANKNKKLEVQDDISYTISIPDEWKFFNALDDRFGDKGAPVESGKNSVSILPVKGYSYITLSTIRQAFERSVEDLEIMEKNTRGYMEELPGYAREVITFNSYPALKVSYKMPAFYELPDMNFVEYYIPHGTATIKIGTMYDSEKNKDEIDAILKTYVLHLDTKPNYVETEITSDFPKVQVKNTSSGWHMIEGNYNVKAPAFRVLLEHHSDLDAHIQMEYDKYLDSANDPTFTERYTYLQNQFASFGTIFAKGDNLLIGGKKAFFILTKTTKNDFYAESNEAAPKANLHIMIPDGVYFYTIEVEVPLDSYSEYLPSIKSFLAQIQFDSSTESRLYKLTALEGSFIDTANYRYEVEISDLKARGIIKGYQDKTFRPTQNISRAEFLKILLESLPEEKKVELQNYKELAASGYAFTNASELKDIENEWYKPYIMYALDKGIIKGYPDKSFRPHQEVALAEALKMLFLSNDITYWNVEALPYDVAWYIPLIDKAYELSLLPEGLSEAAEYLTRGEMAYLIYHIQKPSDTYFGY